MLIRRTEHICCVYHNVDEQAEDIDIHLKDGWKVMKEGAATFNEISLKGVDGFKPGEIYRYTEYIRDC